MTMLPVFIIGFMAGLIVAYVYGKYEKETPSETKLHMLEKELEQEKKDKEMLDKLVDKLYMKIDELENENNRRIEL